MDELEALKRILQRERLARLEAERILEEKSRQLYNLNQELLALNTELESRVELRTNLLRESEERHRALFDQYPLPLFIVRLDDSTILHSNRTAEEVYGFPLHYFQTQKLTDLGPLELEAELHALQVGRTTEFLSEHLRADKRRMDVEMHVRGIWYQSQRAAIVMVLDVTRRNRAITALAQSEEKYRGIIENLQLGMLEVDRDGCIKTAYPKFCELVGYTSDELVGKDAKAMLLFSDEQPRMNTIEKEREHGKASVYEIRLRHKNGSDIWVVVSGAPLYDQEGKVAGSVGIHLDIRKRKLLERDLMLARDQAEESSRIKEVFLANMSHEIRTPMNAIIGIGNLLCRTPLNEEQTEYLQSIQTSANNLLHLINDLLDLSKVQAGKLELEERPFDLQNLLQQVGQMLYYKAEDRGIGLYVEQQLAQRQVIGDEQRLFQVLVNLTANAIKFTDQGEVRLEVLEPGPDAPANWSFRVIDTGIGIEPEKLAAVFDPYTQADPSIQARFGGTGLGLSISREIVLAMGGKIWVESALAQGSTFYVEVPLEPAQHSGQPSLVPLETPMSEHPLKGYRILLVEDDPINQLLASKLLQRWGAAITIAGHGGIALQRLAEQTFDAVLMDVQMPVMDGPTTTRHLRDQGWVNLPVIALTANAIKGDREHFLAAGMNAYVSKPFTERELLQTLLAQISAAQAGELGSHAPAEDTHTPAADKTAPAPNDLAQTAEPLNLQQLQTLTGQDKTFEREMLALFREQATLSLDGLEEALAHQDWNRIRFLAHRMKYQLDTLGGPQARQLIRQLEALPQNIGTTDSEDLHALPQQLSQLSFLVRALVAQAGHILETPN